MLPLRILDATECERTRKLVHALRASWVQRSPLPFFTLGAATYMDATRGRRSEYLEFVARLNPVLRDHFGWLHERVRQNLANALGETVVAAPGLALPGFHVFLAHPAFMKPLASVHVDLQYLEHPWHHLGVPDFERPISFTLAIALPAAGGGLLTWPRNAPHAGRPSEHEMAAAVRQITPVAVPYTPGSLVVHDGHLLHQIAPAPNLQPGDERITLQGHGIRCGDVVYTYW